MLKRVADSPGDKAALDAAGVQLAQPEVVRRVQGRLQVPVHPQAVRRAGAPLRRPKRKRVLAEDAETQEGKLGKPFTTLHQSKLLWTVYQRFSKDTYTYIMIHEAAQCTPMHKPFLPVGYLKE